MKPLLAITMGDVAGVGPEIILKALSDDTVNEACHPLVIGDVGALGRAATGLRLSPSPTIVQVGSPDNCSFEAGVVNILQPGPALAEVPVGRVSAVAGEGSVRFVKAAAELALDRQIDGIVTAPLNKAAMNLAGHPFPGHTELLAELTGTEHFSLVLSADELFIFHVTTHVALREACDLVTRDRTLDTVRLAHHFAVGLGMPDEPVAVAGLNPHAGENGLFGTEEVGIADAVAVARKSGIPAIGPLPADALLPKAIAGLYRFVVVCYHDQGHVTFKSVYGDRGVNITVGLPVVRVSVDHGTAFDIAGQGIARADGLREALRQAQRLAPIWDRVHASTTGGFRTGRRDRRVTLDQD